MKLRMTIELKTILNQSVKEGASNQSQYGSFDHVLAAAIFILFHSFSPYGHPYS